MKARGLLDITHIRFFTLAEVRDMFAQTGYRVDAVVHGIDPPFMQLSEMEPDKEFVNLQVGSLVFNNASRADRVELRDATVLRPRHQGPLIADTGMPRGRTQRPRRPPGPR